LNKLPGAEKSDENIVPGTEDTDDASTEGEAFSDQVLTGEDIIQVWHRYVETLASNEPRMFNALKNQEPLVDINQNGITIPFRNKALIAEFKENFKESFIGFLKGKFESVDLAVSEKLLDDDEAPRAKYYTDVDKLKYMIEKNPALGKLKQEFNLDFE
jgi:hypothetical protein